VEARQELPGPAELADLMVLGFLPLYLFLLPFSSGPLFAGFWPRQP
jgi:hypothetical protein